MRIVSDIFAYTAAEMPRFNSISISGYHIAGGRGDRRPELAYTIADGLEYVRCGLDAGLDIDDFAPRLSFFLGIGMNFFMEVAKLRAARLLWAALMRQFQPADPRSSVLRAHCQTSGWSLTADDVYNNVARTCIEAMAATQGHTQSLHTNSFDEALRCRSDFSARIARNTQLVPAAREAAPAPPVDPWGGSYYLEWPHRPAGPPRHRTHRRDRRHGRHGRRHRGRRAQARIEQAAPARRPASTAGTPGPHRREPLPPEVPESVELLAVDNAEVLAAQTARLAEGARRPRRGRLRGRPGGGSPPSAPAAGDGNLLDLSVRAARAWATVGEISDALERGMGRHTAEVRTISGVYSQAAGAD